MEDNLREASFGGQFWRPVLEDNLEQARELGRIAISYFNTLIASKHGVYPQNPQALLPQQSLGVYPQNP